MLLTVPLNHVLTYEITPIVPLNHVLTYEITLTVPLKGVFAKNEKGYRLTAIKKRF